MRWQQCAPRRELPGGRSGAERGAGCGCRTPRGRSAGTGAWPPLSLGPPEALQESGADTRVPPGVGRAPGGVGTVLLQGPGCSDSTRRAAIPAPSLPGGGKPRQQRTPRAAGSRDRPLTAAMHSGAEHRAPYSVPGVLWRPLPSLQPETAESGGMLPIFQMGKARRSS